MRTEPIHPVDSGMAVVQPESQRSWLAERTPIVHTENHGVFATSRDVAAFFEKEHRNVLRDIEALISADAAIALNFEPIEIPVKVGFGMRFDRAFKMDRDGFTLLAMGFTGPKALKFKLAYIAAFNEALERLKEIEERRTNPVPALPDFSNPAIAARAWADEFEKRKFAEEQNARLDAEVTALIPAAAVGAAVVRHKRTLREFARKLPGVNLAQLQRRLGEFGYLYRQGNSCWHVYRRHEKLFGESFDPTTGISVIYPTDAGQKLLARLYLEGKLVMCIGRIPECTVEIATLLCIRKADAA